MSVEIIVNPKKIAQTNLNLNKIAKRIQNRQLNLNFDKSEGKVIDEMCILANNLLDLGDALSTLVFKTAQIIQQTGDTFEQNLDGSNFSVKE